MMTSGVIAMEGRRPWRAAKRNTITISAPAREANGRLQRGSTAETEKQVLATVLAQPHRRNIKPQPNKPDGARGPRDVRAGYAFGRMALGGEISRVQHDALAHWLDTHLHYVRTLGLPAVRYGSCLAVAMDGRGGYDGDDPSPERTAARANGAKRAYEALEDAMADGMGRELTAAQSALVHVVLMDREPASGMVGYLRAVANVIDRYRSVTGGSKAD